MFEVEVEVGTKRAGIRRAVLACGFFMVLSSVGCALSSPQVDAIRNFSLSTATVGEIAASEFVTMRNSTIEMNARRLKLEPPTDPKEVRDLDRKFDVDAVQARVQAATTLKAYGELLLSLATHTEAEEMKKASDGFVSSVGALEAGDRKLNDQQLEALGTIVTTIGNWIVEHKKANAVRKIVKDSEDQVAHLCQLLGADFDPSTLQLSSDFAVTADDLRDAAGAVLQDEPNAPIQRRAQAVADYRLAEENSQRLDAISLRASKAVAKLTRAQGELITALESTEFSISEIKSLAKEAKTLHEAIKVLGSNPSNGNSEG